MALHQQESIVYLAQFTLQCKLKTQTLVRREALFGLFIFLYVIWKSGKGGTEENIFHEVHFLTLHCKIVNPKLEKETATGQLSLP